MTLSNSFECKKCGKSPLRIGRIGELAVQLVLLQLESHFNVYIPLVDDNEVDMIVENKHGNFDRINVKHPTKLKTKTSIEVRLRKHQKSKRVDILAVYYEPVGVAFLPYAQMGYPASINLAIHTAVNNQDKKRNYFYQYMRYPEFE